MRRLGFLIQRSYASGTELQRASARTAALIRDLPPRVMHLSNGSASVPIEVQLAPTLKHYVSAGLIRSELSVAGHHNRHVAFYLEMSSRCLIRPTHIA